MQNNWLFKYDILAPTNADVNNIMLPTIQKLLLKYTNP
jgi:hypothetical protein